MNAQRWTPDVIRSRDWSFRTLRRMARDCRDVAEGQAILEVFWRKVGEDPARHGRHCLPMLASCAWLTDRDHAEAGT
jgi:hypothetical protein